MKILHINYYDIKGGAALAAYRLCKKQREMGLDARMVVAEKFSDDSWVIPLPGKIVKKLHFLQHAEALWNRIAGKNGNILPFSLNLLPVGSAKFINGLPRDILHLHWINGQMLSIGETAQLTGPVVWTLHDNWAYCGAEHYHQLEDLRYETGYRGLRTEDWIWRRKEKLWKNFFPVIVGPSKWICREAENSKLFFQRRVEHIFNGISTECFFPHSKSEARKHWGLPPDRPVIVIGAASLSDENKGGKLLKDTLALFPEVSVLAIGKNASKELHPRLFAAGNISDPEQLALAYSAGDLFLSVARYDNLPNMLIEAAACGTPVVAVNAGGAGEIVGTANGITAPPEPGALAEAVGKILNKESVFTPSAREFDIENTVANYLKLYRSITEQKSYGE